MEYKIYNFILCQNGFFQLFLHFLDNFERKNPEGGDVLEQFLLPSKNALKFEMLRKYRMRNNIKEKSPVSGAHVYDTFCAPQLADCGGEMWPTRRS